MMTMIRHHELIDSWYHEGNEKILTSISKKITFVNRVRNLFHLELQIIINLSNSKINDNP